MARMAGGKGSGKKKTKKQIAKDMRKKAKQQEEEEAKVELREGRFYRFQSFRILFCSSTCCTCGTVYSWYSNGLKF
jgi:hypothetical protein